MTRYPLTGVAAGDLPVRRPVGWQAALFRAVSARQGAAFAYGRFDCCTAAADCVDAMTGIDLMAGLRGRYRSAAGACRLIREGGARDLFDLVHQRAASAGFPPISPLHAGQGDLLLARVAIPDACRGQAVGICMGRVGFFAGQTGWTGVPVSQCNHAFRVQKNG
ncbi:DUF6950 family protein [Yunchengibacter salinarum]|uniref:DUF6950 family protein n=1 Tax=Yunchengibacter salinarum TaxID=3133399 RepID=UPI0035B5A539